MYIEVNTGITRSLYREIVDVELASYDEISVSTMVVPCFKVSLFLETPQPFTDIETFSRRWQGYKQVIQVGRSLEVKLYDKNGTKLADGVVYEYNEKRDERVVELKCRSDVTSYFEQRINIDRVNNNAISTGANYLSRGDDTRNMTAIMRMYRSWFLFVRDIAFPRITFIASDEHWMSFFIHFIRATLWRFNNDFNGGSGISGYYNLRVCTKYSGTRRDLLTQLSYYLKAKFIIHTDNIIEMVPFAEIDSNPVVVNGYISKEKHETVQQISVSFTLIERVVLRRGQSYSVVDLPNILTNTRRRLREIEKCIKYTFWGFAVREESKMIFSGQTIFFDYENYLVQDIKYDKETLNGMKSFNATCVRFI